MNDDTSKDDEEQRLAGPVGVVVCRCGSLMSDWVDVSALSRRAGPDPRAAFVREQAYSCFGEGLEAIVEAARERPILVAACAPELHGPTLSRALERAGLPPDRAQLVDVRGEGWACRGRARGTSFAETLLAEALGEVDLPAGSGPAPLRRVTLIGGGPAADEAASLLEASGVAVDWLDDPSDTDPGAPGVPVTRVERTAEGFRIERTGTDALAAGALVLAFEALDQPAEAMRPAFEPGSQVMDLASVEAALEGVAELPAEPPSVVALVTGCIAGSPRSRAPGVALARTLDLALALRERWPRTRLVLFHGDDAGAPPELEATLAGFRREAGGLTVRGAVHRGVYSEGAIHVHATDADLGKRVMLAADFCVVDPGQQDDPRARAWCELLGIPDVRELSSGDVFTRIPGVLVASGPHPTAPAEAALRGAACAAHCLARLSRTQG